LLVFLEQDFNARDYKGLATPMPAVKASKRSNCQEK